MHARIQKVLSVGSSDFFLVDQGRDDPNSAKSWPLSGR